MTNDIISKAKKRFCRKNAQTGKYEPKWFVEDATTYQDIEQFIIEEFAQDRKAFCEKIEGLRKDLNFSDVDDIIKSDELMKNSLSEAKFIRIGFNQAIKDILNIIKK